MIEADDGVTRLERRVESAEVSSRVSKTSDDHSHQLARTNILICQDCHRFFVITYEKNERGEAVETGYELDVHAKKVGAVASGRDSLEGSQLLERLPRRSARNSRNETCW